VLITLHLPVHVYSPAAFETDRPQTFVHCVSASQQRTLSRTRMQVLPPIPNGVPLEAWRAVRCRSNYVLALGRICPEKGFHLAARAARSAGLPLILGGQVFAYQMHQDYFRDTLSPLLDRRRFRFVGPLRRVQKRILLRNAHCLLVPSQTPETSSLVAMEAAAVGTPVIAFRAGALPEVVEHGRTGFVVDSVEEMAEAIHQVDRIDRRACRAVAQQHFSARAMAARYLDRYTQLAGEARPIRNAQRPAGDSRVTVSEEIGRAHV